MTLLLLASLTLRWLVLVAASPSEVPLLYDESGYFDRGLAFRDIYISLGHLETPDEALWDRAYGKGHWPPLHAMLLGVGLAIGGPTVAVARLIMVFLAALTTPLVFRLTLDLASSRSAWAAAGIHLLYPTLISYSHYLWSETTAIFLLLSALWLATRAVAENRRWQTMLLAAATGGILGLGALTRAASLPFVFIVPIWLASAARQRRSRLAIAAIALTASLIVLLPWQLVTTSREGRFVPLSTLGGYNLALGNNPWVPEGYGSSWGHETSKARLHASLHEIAERESIDWASAGFVVARQELQTRPGAFLRRSLERIQMLWAPDFFPLRHLFSAVYPPLPPILASVLALVSVATYCAVVLLSLCGLMSRNGLAHRGLLITLLAAGMLLPAVTLGISRLHLPLLALLLPAAGHGLSSLLPPEAARPRRTTIIAGFLLLAVIAGTVPRVVALYLVPSSYYTPVLAPLPGVDVTYSDRVVLRWSGGPPDELRIRLLDPKTRWADGTREQRWRVGHQPAELDLVVFGTTDKPLAIEIASASLGRSSQLRPITRETWRRWQPTGVAGVDARWTGGGPSPR